MTCSGRNYKVYEAKNLEIGDFLLTKKGDRKIVSIKSAGVGVCYDITLLKSDNLFQGEPNFILANGIVSHNCNLPIIDDCIRLIKENRGIEIKRAEIPIDDKESIRFGTQGELLGIFQFENPYTKKIADKVGVESLGDIAAITSLIRPGPKDVGLDIEYAERKNGKKYISNPFLKKVMGDTWEIMTYQEQLQKLAIEMAGFSPLEANALRKACAKKKADLMAKMKPKFIEGSIERAVKTGIMTEEQVLKTWEMIESTASYSFNRSHAVAYSAITTTELWLRYHYFHEYMTALIQNADPKKEKFGQTIFDKYIKFSIDNGLCVHKPDINHSKVGFSLKGTDVYFALGHVKNVSSAAEYVVKYQPYTGIEDFYDRCNVEVGTEGKTRRANTRVVESLIYAGAFDRFGDRASMFKKFYELTGRVEKWQLPRVPVAYKGFAENVEPTLNDSFECVLSNPLTDNCKIKKVSASSLKSRYDDSCFETLRTIAINQEVKYIDLPDLGEKALIEKEKEMISVMLSGNLLAMFRDQTKDIKGLCGITRLKHEVDKVKVKVLGRITGIKEINFKTGSNGLRVYVTDGTKDMNFLVFQSAVNSFRDFYRENDIAVIPLKNFGKESDDPTFRFFDDKEQGLILKRIE